MEDTATRYMGDDRVLVDLIGQQRVRTAVTVEHKAVCCPYQERPTVINDVIQVQSVLFCMSFEGFMTIVTVFWISHLCTFMFGTCAKHKYIPHSYVSFGEHLF